MITLASSSFGALSAQQWNGATNSTGTITRQGNVGIGLGVKSPSANLHLFSPAINGGAIPVTTFRMDGSPVFFDAGGNQYAEDYFEFKNTQGIFDLTYNRVASSPFTAINNAQRMSLNGQTGAFRINALAGTGTRILGVSPDGTLTTTGATTIAGTGIAGTGGILSIAADNGIVTTADGVRLGGTLIQNTTINQGINTMRFTGTGNFGIGNTAPAVRLQVDGGQMAVRNEGVIDFNFVNGNRWSALGERPGFGTTADPNIRTTGLRTLWNEYAVNLGLTDGDSDNTGVKNGLLTWQDGAATTTGTLRNQLIFGARDGGNNSLGFQEVARMSSAEAGTNFLVTGRQMGLGTAGNYGDFDSNAEWISLGAAGVGTPSAGLLSGFYGMAINRSGRFGLLQLVNVTRAQSTRDLVLDYGNTDANGNRDINQRFKIRNVVQNGTTAPVATDNLTISNGVVYINTPEGNAALASTIAANGGTQVGNFPPNGQVRLYVSGDTRTTGVFYNSSDGRFKRNIKEIEAPFSIIENLRGTTYEMRTKEFESYAFSEGKKYGFIAQELQKVMPEAVIQGIDGYLAVNYDAVVPVLVEALKEERAERKAEKQDFEERLAKLEAMIIGGESTKKVSVQQSVNIKGENQLFQNTPNPFTGTTVIDYKVNSDKEAFMLFFDQQGRELKRELLTAKGEGQISLSLENIPAGVYSYSLLVDGLIVDTKKMIFKGN